MKKERDYFELSKVCCFLGNFPPKECGIATFTKDLATAMNKKWNPRLKSRIIALNDESCIYNYNKKVVLEINREDIEEFINVAKKINESEIIKIVCIQHEFGIFGGDYGSYIIPFLETIKKPVVTTFHSVLPNPDKIRKRIVQYICSKSSGVIVMAKKAVEILHNDYEVDPEKIHVIYHGIPDVPFQSRHISKKNLKLESKTILSTFGLLSRGKGIEYMIEAMPELIKKYPNLLYLVIGETHPNIRREEGESYRNELMKRVKDLGLTNHVKFYNKYLSLQEIITYLLASDIYICTNLDKNQIVSGTLSYAMGSGAVVISTPSVYAEEVLSEERGIIINFKDPFSYAQAIDKVLSDEELKAKLQENAYSFSRQMTWQNVATQHLKIFNQITNLREDTVKKFPYIKLNHLNKLTDDIGVLQFSKLFDPDKSSGYTVDDNSRALISSVLHNKLFKSKNSNNLIKIYLNFLEKSQNEEGWFNNIIENSKVLCNSEDAFGRAVWALGFAAYKSENPEIVEKSKNMFEKSQKHIERLKYPRSRAFSLLGLYNYYKKFSNPETLEKIKNIADELVELYEKESSKNWQWFEPHLTYSNSKLPEALFLAYEITKNPKYLKVAEKTLNFLSDVLFINGKLAPIGQNGWYKRSSERAFFDQQPIDASNMVQTYLVAYNITKNKEYYQKAILSFNWFLGKNYLNQMIYNESTGGCYDGLAKESVNLNQGAESTISYLIARLMLEESKKGLF
ncbi:MAG: glycosyltransferase [archaeon]